MIFNGATDTCPLCGQDVYIGYKKLRNLSAKTYRIGRIECNISQLFLVFAVNVSIICTIVNLVLGVTPFWAAYPIVGVFTAHVVFAMLLGYRTPPSGIRRIALLHAAGASVLQFFFFDYKGGEWWMFGTYMPIFLIAATIAVMVIFFLPNTKRVSLFVSMLLLAMMGAALLVLLEMGVVPGKDPADAAYKLNKILIITSFSIVAGIFANYTIYMLFCLKSKFRSVMK